MVRINVTDIRFKTTFMPYPESVVMELDTTGIVILNLDGIVREMIEDNLSAYGEILSFNYDIMSLAR